MPQIALALLTIYLEQLEISSLPRDKNYYHLNLKDFEIWLTVLKCS